MWASCIPRMVLHATLAARAAASRSGCAIIDGIAVLVGWARWGKRSETKSLGTLGRRSRLNSGCEMGIFDLEAACRSRARVVGVGCYGLT